MHAGMSKSSAANDTTNSAATDDKEQPAPAEAGNKKPPKYPYQAAQQVVDAAKRRWLPTCRYNRYN